MNSEESRLETFKDWPSDAVVSPIRIAKAGFYATKEGLNVECFSCHLQITEWTYGDQVMAKHKTLSPLCKFVLDPSTSGNITIILPDAMSHSPIPSSSKYKDFKIESIRLESFNNWPIPHIVTPEALSHAGFYWIQKRDITRCAFCKGSVSSWVPEDDPDREHKRHFPTCPFVISNINPRLLERLPRDHSLSNLELVANENFDELGVNTHKAPKKPSCATLESRLRTFSSWPLDLIQTPEILAQAGFYYEGTGDQVRCFHCDGGLRHWDPEDDPWTEHARWFPLCSFVKIVKGQDFIVSCLNEQVDNKSEKVNKRPEPPRRWPVSDRDLEQCMTSEIVMTALNIGLNVERIKRAIREKIAHTGRSFSSPDALILATVNMQFEENDEYDCDQGETMTPAELSPARLTTVEQQHQQQSEPIPSAVDSSTQNSPVGAEAAKPLSLEEENRILKEARLCKICMDGEMGVVFLPCGHFVTCVNCAPYLQDCPVCRSTIKATVRTFLT